MKMRSILLIAAVLLLPACSTAAKVKQYRVKVVKEYPHDPAAYTQGLFFHDGKLYESTGQFGNSSFRTVDLETGKSLTSMQFNRTYFAEGSVIFKDDLYILTWTNKVVFKYDPVTLTYRSTQRYPREGWGLTTDGKSLIASDGTASLYFMDASLKVEKTLPVRINGRQVRYLNELEWKDLGQCLYDGPDRRDQSQKRRGRGDGRLYGSAAPEPEGRGYRCPERHRL